MKTNINHTIRKTWSYWYIDGLVEILGGVVVLLIALLQFVLSLPQFRPAAAIGIGLGQPLLILGGLLIGGRIVSRFKERWTYPHTGYVAYPKKGPRRKLFAAVLGGMFSIVILLVLNQLIPIYGDRFLPALVGVLMGVFVAYLGWRVAVRRFYWIGGLTFLSGLYSAWANLPAELAMIPILLVLGLGWLIGGSLTLNGYLRSVGGVTDTVGLDE